MNRIGKYNFTSQNQALDAIDSLGIATDENGNEYSTSKSTFVHLGHIVLTPGEYDEDGNETVAPILSDDWHVDVLWTDLIPDEDGNVDHPEGWADHSAVIEGEGVHAFFGLNYQSLSF